MSDPSKIKKIKLDADTLLELGKKGKCLYVVQSAFIFAKMNEFEGTVIKAMAKPEALVSTKAWKAQENGVGGAYWMLEDSSDTFKALYELAKAARNSINKMEYDKAVTDLIDAFYNIPSLKGRKGKTLEKDSLKDLKL